MPVFRYQAIDKRGRNLSGTMPALDETNLQKRLKELGLWLTDAALEKAGPVTYDPPKAGLKISGLRGKRLRRELIDFCTLVSFLIRSGMPLVKALEVAGQDCADPRFREVVSGVRSNIESGMEFHEALARYPGVFSHNFVSVIRAGVISSKLPETLANLKEYLEWVDQVIADVRQATLYPAIVLSVVVAFVAFLFTFVIPKFAELLDKLHVHKPVVTEIVLTLSATATATWWMWMPAFLFLVLGVPIGRRISPAFAKLVDRVKLRVPIFGPLNHMLALSRFSHNLAILYQSGIPILDALKLCQQGLIGNSYVEDIIGKVAYDVKTGSTISESMQRYPVFSAMLLRMVAMGESTGRLDEALVNVANYYNDVIPRRIKSLFTVLEPALMLFLIFTVGTVALAIYLPILSLMGSIR